MPTLLPPMLLKSYKTTGSHGLKLRAVKLEAVEYHGQQLGLWNLPKLQFYLKLPGWPWTSILTTLCLSFCIYAD